MCSDPWSYAQHRPVNIDIGSHLVLGVLWGKWCTPFTDEEAEALRGKVSSQGHTIHITWMSGGAGAIREDFLEMPRCVAQRACSARACIPVW